jgi:homoserine O-acetyltransferase
MGAQSLPTKKWSPGEDFSLPCGETLSGLEIAYETWGELSAEGDNVVVILHALSGSSHAFSSAENPDPGWWEELYGEEAPLRTEGCHVICANIIGSCYGTTGPSSINPSTGAPYATEFPQITLRDMVEAQRLLLKELGIDKPVTLLGGSMGGMLILEWMSRHPKEVSRAICLATPARSEGFTIALRSVQRDAILSDPNYNKGFYDEENFPAAGLSLARKIGMITYRSPVEFNARFGRDVKDPRSHFLEGLYEVQSYLDHQGQKFVGRFDPNTYLYFSRAMDLFDIAAGHDSVAAAFRGCSTRVLLLSIDSDFLVPTSHMAELCTALTEAGLEVELQLMESRYGHDAFLLETGQINRHIGNFLQSG